MLFAQNSHCKLMWIADDDLVGDMTKTQPPTLIAVHYSFLSDPSPIIGYACHSLTDSLTHSVTLSKLD